MVFEMVKDYDGKRTIIPNGIDLNEFNPNAKKVEKFCDRKLNILFVGRIEKRKGLIYAIKAYELLKRKHQDIRLVVVGEGPLEDECREYVAKNKIEDVCFEGTKTGADLVKYYCTADIFCAPSIFGESFGIILLEAMACSKPVVGFSNKGYAQTFKNTKGEEYLVEPKNFNALAEKMERLITDKEERFKMQEWGMDEVQKYGWPNIADEVLKFYQECKRKPLN